MEWYQFILAVIVGLVTYVLGYRNTISATVSEAITKAEKDYQGLEKAGKDKMIAAIKFVRSNIPSYLQVFFTDAWIEKLVQDTFDATKEFVKLQADKIVEEYLK